MRGQRGNALQQLLLGQVPRCTWPAQLLPPLPFIHRQLHEHGEVTRGTEHECPITGGTDGHPARFM